MNVPKADMLPRQVGVDIVSINAKNAPANIIDCHAIQETEVGADAVLPIGTVSIRMADPHIHITIVDRLTP